MATQVFYRKWRPRTLAEVVGQEPVTQTLLNALASGRISHAYLFCGPRGTGKTSTARILAKAVNCLNSGRGEPCNACAMCQAISEGRALDVIEIDAASNNSVEDVRSLREKVSYAPNEARYKVYIVDEVHMLSNSASNALLKTLEEPPPHVIFILATTEAHKVLATIMSRCQRFDFRRHTQDRIIAELGRVCRGEGIKVDPAAMRLIARSATGSMRDALNLLELLATYYGAEIGLGQVQATLGISGDQRIKQLAGHIVDGNIPAGIATINSMSNDSIDLRQLNRELVEYLRALLLAKTNVDDALDFTAEDIAELKAMAARSSLERIVTATRLFGQLNFRFDGYSTLPMELALIDSVTAGGEVPAVGPTPVGAGSPKAVTASAASSTGRTVSEPRPAATAAALVQTKPSPAAAADLPQPKPAPVPPVPASAKPAATVTPPVAATPLEASSEIERLKLNWKLILKQAPAETQKTAALAVLRSGDVRPVSVENNTVCLSFKQKIFKDMIEKTENQRVTEKIISNFLGHACQIKCILEENHLVKEALKIGAQITEVEER